MEPVEFRLAGEEDLYDVVTLLIEDNLGIGRETLTNPLPKAYIDAFEAMQSQNGNNLVVAALDDKIVGCYQFTIIHGISRSGMSRAQIEGVRVASSMRGQGLGHKMMKDAIDRAKRQGCGLVQLTSDKTRSDAQRFYSEFGFVDSHVGYKLDLT